MKKTILILLTVLLVLSCGAAVYLHFFPLIPTGWTDVDGTLYYYDEEGVLYSGWLEEETGRHYLTDGLITTGWVEIDGKTYLFDSQGDPVTGWQEIDGAAYYLLEDGTTTSGWIQVDGVSYYLDDAGILVTGWLTGSDGTYYLGEDGSPVTGFTQISGDTYYFNEDCLMTTGWTDIDGSRYYFGPTGIMQTGLTELEALTYCFSETGAMTTGWVELEDGYHYFSEEGPAASGWVEIDGTDYYLDADGSIYTGWLQLNGYDYYLLEDGTYATGKLELEDGTYFFTPEGIHVILVNSNYPVPEDYEVDLVTFTGSYEMDSSCYDALVAMIEACNEAGFYPTTNAAYRSKETQQGLLYSRIAKYKDAGYSEAGAAELAYQSVAKPGHSEHQLGLAIDLGGAAAQTWLKEHCWEYGFILRYPEDKTDITGIIYEPWHYRYVGVEVAMAMKDTGLCLEEYLGAVEAEAE